MQTLPPINLETRSHDAHTEDDKGPHGPLVLSTQISGKLTAVGELGTMLSEVVSAGNCMTSTAGSSPDSTTRQSARLAEVDKNSGMKETRPGFLNVAHFDAVWV